MSAVSGSDPRASNRNYPSPIDPSLYRPLVLVASPSSFERCCPTLHSLCQRIASCVISFFRCLCCCCCCPRNEPRSYESEPPSPPPLSPMPSPLQQAHIVVPLGPTCHAASAPPLLPPSSMASLLPRVDESREVDNGHRGVELDRLSLQSEEQMVPSMQPQWVYPYHDVVVPRLQLAKYDLAFVPNSVFGRPLPESLKKGLGLLVRQLDMKGLDQKLKKMMENPSKISTWDILSLIPFRALSWDNKKIVDDLLSCWTGQNIGIGEVLASSVASSISSFFGSKKPSVFDAIAKGMARDLGAIHPLDITHFILSHPEHKKKAAEIFGIVQELIHPPHENQMSHAEGYALHERRLAHAQLLNTLGFLILFYSQERSYSEAFKQLATRNGNDPELLAMLQNDGLDKTAQKLRKFHHFVTHFNPHKLPNSNNVSQDRVNTYRWQAAFAGFLLKNPLEATAFSQRCLLDSSIMTNLIGIDLTIHQNDVARYLKSKAGSIVQLIETHIEQLKKTHNITDQELAPYANELSTLMPVNINSGKDFELLIKHFVGVPLTQADNQYIQARLAERSTEENNRRQAEVARQNEQRTVVVEEKKSEERRLMIPADKRLLPVSPPTDASVSSSTSIPLRQNGLVSSPGPSHTPPLQPVVNSGSSSLSMGASSSPFYAIPTASVNSPSSSPSAPLRQNGLLSSPTPGPTQIRPTPSSHQKANSASSSSSVTPTANPQAERLQVITTTIQTIMDHIHDNEPRDIPSSILSNSVTVLIENEVHGLHFIQIIFEKHKIKLGGFIDQDHPFAFTKLDAVKKYILKPLFTHVKVTPSTNIDLTDSKLVDLLDGKDYKDVIKRLSKHPYLLNRSRNNTSTQ